MVGPVLRQFQTIEGLDQVEEFDGLFSFIRLQRPN